jgi:hypothetical protein
LGDCDHQYSFGYSMRRVRIPAKAAIDSDRKAPFIPTESIQWSERSDAGVNIISEVDGFGQTRTSFSSEQSSGFFLETGSGTLP